MKKNYGFMTRNVRKQKITTANGFMTQNIRKVISNDH